MKHQQKILYTIDRLFEKQLRSKEPNEVFDFILIALKFKVLFLLNTDCRMFYKIKVLTMTESKFQTKA